MITRKPVESICCCLTPPPVGQDIVGEVRVLTGLLLLRFAREIDESCPRDNFGGKLFDDGGTEGGEKHPWRGSGEGMRNNYFCCFVMMIINDDDFGNNNNDYY